MKNELLNDVMHVIRRDGSAKSPVCFLSIEDGGELKAESFDEYIQKPDTWIPEKGVPMTETVGLPGEFISKIMSYAFGDLVNCSSWREYREQKLYRDNECNVKFYPIGRHNVGVWEPWLQDRLGITTSEYKMQCVAERPEIIFNESVEYFSGADIFVILGALDEWSYFLRKYLCADFSLASVVGNGEFVLPLSHNKVIAYYPIFKRGYRSSERLESFSKTLKDHTNDRTLSRFV